MKLSPVVVILIILFNQTWASFVGRTCPSACRCYPDPRTRKGVIDCSSRNLTKIPDTGILYPRGVNLARIDFSNNELTVLDVPKLYELIRGLTIDVLDFSGNRISEVEGRFDVLEGIDYAALNLSSNAFTSFPRNVVPVRHHRGNFILDFSHNQLTELPRHMFNTSEDPTLYGFQFLASNNLISRIDEEAFVGVYGVQLVDTVLDLRSNQLTNLSRDFKTPLGVREIRLSDNPWECDCDLRWIIDPDRFLINFTASDPPNCEGPAPLRGQPIFRLGANDFACLPIQQGSLTTDIDVDQEIFAITCPVTADPPNPVITWTLWLPRQGRDPERIEFVSEGVTFQSSSGMAFRCTASNNAGSVALDLDVRYNGRPGIPIPEGQ